MALSTVPDTVQVEITQLYGGKFLENVWNFRSTISEVSPATISQLANAITEWITIWYKFSFVSALLFNEIRIKSLDFTAPYESNGSLGIVGDQNTEGLPVNAAIMTQFLTGLIGRSYKGRSYASGMPKQDFTINQMESIPYTAFVGTWYELQSILVTEDWEHVVVSRIQNEVTIDPAIATPITLYAVNPLVADMGRRLNNS